jgi:two-component system, cell cycle response regulator
MKILIADDEPVSRRLLEGTLKKLGHDVLAVEDGTQAVATLLEPDGPRMAILDWMMPGCDGLAVCREVRKRAAPYTYVILLTSRDRRSDMVEALDAEVDDFLTKPYDAVELRARLRSGERVLLLQETLLQAQEMLRHEATHDRLTGLWNRARIIDHLRREARRTDREKAALAVLLVDIDHFKQVNDTYGHGVGDVVLHETAQRMRSVLRDYETIGRYGGEEFLIVLSKADLAVSRQVGERIRAVVGGAPIVHGHTTVDVKVSVGLASTETGFDATALVNAADSALYRAKQQGRNTVAE